MKIRSRENFGEFIRFFSKGLNHIKIHRRFKFESVPGFLTLILLGVGSRPNGESCPEYSYLAALKA
jgi:hypothetical protein